MTLRLSRRRVLALSASLLLPLALPAQRRPADPLAGFDAYAERLMATWKVPGMAIAVVRGDSVIYARGFGVRTIGDTAKVDAHTLFAIGSSSKAFTGAAVALLADEGKLSLDSTVTTYLPWFQMYDPWVTRAITVRDLLLHRSGLNRGDNLWYATTRSREDVVRGIRLIAPSTSFRTHFQYQNLMYITAGEVAHAVSGQSWDDIIKTRIFAPLGMRESNTSVRDLAGQRNVATPHADLGAGVRAVAYRNIDNAAPAGSINSNVLDMGKWIAMWLGEGTTRGTRILSPEKAREAMTPQFVVDEESLAARVMAQHYLGYAFGWFVTEFRGRRFLNHGGNIDGMAALVSFLPDEKLGVVVLTNMNQSDVTFPLTANLYDRLLGVSPPKDYDPEYREAERAFDEKQHARTPAPAHVTGTSPSLPLEAYAGTYRNAIYGTMTVTLSPQGRLVIQYAESPLTAGELEHWHFDTFMAVMRDPMMGRVPVTFRVGGDGKVSALSYPMGGATEWVRR